MVPKPASSPRPASFCYDVNKLTRDLTIDDFSDMDLSEITRDDYTSSMESLVSLRSNKPIGLLPQRRAPLSRSQSLRDAKQAPPKKCLSLSDAYDRPAEQSRVNHSRLSEDKKSITKASFKELCGWGVFRPLEVDAAVLKGKVVVPTHIASFGLSAKVKGQLPVTIGEPLVIKSSENINDEWVMGTSLRTGKKGVLPGLYATALETPPALFTLYYLGSARVPHHKGGKTLWEGVGNVLKRKLRPILMNLIVSNDGLRLIQMNQLKKRDFVATDHLLTYSTFIPLHMVSYCGTDSTTGRYFSFISRNFDPEQGCAAHAFVSLESSLEMTSAMEKAFKQGFSSVYDCDLTADEYLE